MKKVAAVATVIVALIHVVIAVVEIGFWTKPVPFWGEPGYTLLEFPKPQDKTAPDGSKMDPKKDSTTMAKPIVKNAGIYNSFIAAGLIWAAWLAWRGGAGSSDAFCIQSFFLICVMIAGVFGAFTLKPGQFNWATIVMQTVPGAIAWGLCLSARPRTP